MAVALTLIDYSSDFSTFSLVLKKEEKLQKNMLRIKLIYAAINPADINMVEGKYLIKPTLPTPLGNEAVGEVVEVGDDVTSFSVGDRVFHPFQKADNWIGFWQSSWVIAEEDCLKVPDFIDSKQAAILSINPITSYLMLTSFVNLNKGDWIIQNCANSAVGRWVIFIAKKLGLKTVNIVRDPSQVATLLDLGADEVLVEHDRFSNSIKQKGSFKLALNGVGGDSAKECAKSLADDGVMLTYGAMAKQPITLGNSLLIFKNLTITGFNRTRWVTKQSRSVIIQAYDDFFKLLDQDCCDIPISKIVSLEQYQDAFEHYNSSDKRGKVLLSL